MSEPLRPDAGRLWAGGAATAVVSALVAIVGILIARGIAGVGILAPKGSGLWGNANTATYAVVAAVAALVATGLFHLLALATPKPATFFGWIMVLLTLIAVVLPLSLSASLDNRIATALLNLVIGLVMTLLLLNLSNSALRRASVRTGDTRVMPQQPPPQPEQHWDPDQRRYY
ncbi:MAG TPA: DUF6069 family protein [Amycolatopsis sp.]|nr:DUF6069 family protein [Amycolatopsis sp.]